MFENVIASDSQKMKDMAKELRDIILEDPTYQEFVAAGGNFAALKDYTESDNDLRQQLMSMENLLSELNGTAFNINPAFNFYNAALRINQLNGYDVKRNAAVIIGNPSDPEVKEKTAGASMTEKVYAFMAEKNYSDIKTEPCARMLIHLARLSEKMMNKLSLMARQSELDNAEKQLDASGDDAPEREFFNSLTGEELHCVLDDKAMKNKQDSIDDELKSINAEINECEVNSLGKKKNSVVKTILKNEPERFVEEFTAIEAEQTEKKKAELAEKTAAYEEKLRAEKKAKEEYNAELAASKDAVKTHNEEIERKMAEAEKQNKEKLAYLDARKESAETLRKVREKDFADIKKTYNNRVSELSLKQDKLRAQIRKMFELQKAKQYLENALVKPDEAHTRTIEAAQAKKNDIDMVTEDMFFMSDRDREAGTAVSYLKPETAAKVKMLHDAFIKAAAAEEKAIDELEHPGFLSSGKAKLEAAVKAAEQKKIKAEAAFKPWEKAFNLQTELNKLYNKYKNPSLEKEINKLTQSSGLSIYRALMSASSTIDRQIKDKKKEYADYYDAMSVFENLSFDEKAGTLPPLSELANIQEELIKTENELNALKAPDKIKFDAETNKQVLNIYDENNARSEEKLIKEEYESEMKKLKADYKATPDYEKVMTEEEIQNAVKDKAGKLDSELTQIYTVYTKIEKEKYVNSISDTLFDNYKSGLEKKKYQLNDQKNALNKKKNKAKEIYNTAKKSFENRDKIKADCKAISRKGPGYAEMLAENLGSVYGRIMDGKTPGHHDTDEFNAMKNALETVYTFVNSNKESINSLDGGTLAQLVVNLTQMRAAAEHYETEKQKGIHWKPSNMRFVRLDTAKLLKSIPGEVSKDLEELKNLNKKEVEVRKKSEDFIVEDPHSFEEYIKYNTPNSTINGMKEIIEGKKMQSEDFKQMHKGNSKVKMIKGFNN